VGNLVSWGRLGGNEVRGAEGVAHSAKHDEVVVMVNGDEEMGTFDKDEAMVTCDNGEVTVI